MGIREEYDFGLLVNEAEKIVIDEMEKQIPGSGICTCKDCVLDVATLALNKVKPRYHVSLMGTLYAQAVSKTDYRKEVKKAVKEAIKKVINNPAHD
jgi:competence protein ComFB